MTFFLGGLIVAAGVFGAVVITGTRRYLRQVKNPRPGFLYEPGDRLP